MKKLKTCVFSAIVLLVISFRDEAESKPVEFPQEREISLKKEMEIVRRLKRYMEENDDFIEKFHSGIMSKRSNLDPKPRSKIEIVVDPLDGPPPAKEAKKSESKTERLHPHGEYKHGPHPMEGKQKTPRNNHGHSDGSMPHNGHGNGGGHEQTSTHKQLQKKNDDFIEKSHSGKSSKRSNMEEEARLRTSLNQAEASQDQAI